MKRFLLTLSCFLFLFCHDLMAYTNQFQLAEFKGGIDAAFASDSQVPMCVSFGVDHSENPNLSVGGFWPISDNFIMTCAPSISQCADGLRFGARASLGVKPSSGIGGVGIVYNSLQKNPFGIFIFAQVKGF